MNMDESQHAEDFAASAKRYVDTIETPAPERVHFLMSVEGLLSQLVARAHDLPRVEPTSSEPAPLHVQAPTGLREVIGDADLYWDVLDPIIAETPKVSTGSLTDDLTEVYLDLKRGLDLWSDGQERDATWEWRFGFETHWGLHAIRALLVLHVRL